MSKRSQFLSAGHSVDGRAIRITGTTHSLTLLRDLLNALLADPSAGRYEATNAAAGVSVRVELKETEATR